MKTTQRSQLSSRGIRFPFLAGAFLLTALWISSSYSAPLAANETLERMQSGVVRIRAGIDDGDESLNWQTGTGFVLRIEKERHYLLTVTHVVKGADKIQVEYRHRRRHFMAAKVERMQGGDPNGIALLSVEGRPPPGTRVLYTEKSAALKAAVVAIGFPRTGEPWHTTRGALQAFQGPRITFSAPVDSGNSGGPLLNGAGHVIGIVTSTRGDRGFATRTVDFAKTLDAWDFQLPNEPVQPTVGIPFPEDWSVLFPNVLVQKLLPRKGGFLLLGTAQKAHTNGTLVYDKGVIFRLDDGFSVVGRQEFTGTKITNPGELMFPRMSFSYIVDGLRRQRGDFFIIEQKSAAAGPFRRLLHLDASGVLTKRVVKLRLQFIALTETTGDRLLVQFKIPPVATLNYTWMDPFADGAPLKIRQTRCAQVSAHVDGSAFCSGYQEVFRFNAAGKTLVRRPNPGNIRAPIHIAPVGQDAMLMIDSPTTGTARLRKFDASLKRVWEKDLSLVGSNYSKAQQLTELADGNLVAVLQDHIGGDTFYSVVYLDSSGRELWRKQIRSASRVRLEFTSLLARANGAFFLTGNRKQASFKNEGFIFGLNRAGKFIAPQ